MSKCDFCTKKCNNDHCVTKTQRVYDPPSGWKYGFPKKVPHEVDTEEKFKQWVIDEGYPVKDIDFALRYGRVWYV